jgi:magnesium transporter
VTIVHSRIYKAGKLVEHDIDHQRISDVLEDEACVIWLDVCNPDGDLLHEMAGELGLHELAVEDALNAHQRPKVDRYADHLFLSCRATRADRDAAELVESEINVFLGQRWMITVRQDDSFDMDEVVARWDRSPDLAGAGISFLLYGLLDVVVDSYFQSVDLFDEYYDEISETIFADKPLDPEHQLEWFQMRRALFRLHRVSVPMREALSSLMRRDEGVITERMYPYFQDVYDHILRVTESTDALRDLVATIVETNLSLRDYRQNIIMKKVTSWAAIIAVPTLITGFYGMNVPYPGFARHSGVWVATVLMVVMSMSLYSVFRSRDWL